MKLSVRLSMFSFLAARHLRIPQAYRFSIRVGSDPGRMQPRSEPESRLSADVVTTPAGTDARRAVPHVSFPQQHRNSGSLAGLA